MFGVVFVFFFKQKTAYEMRISDWSSDVCSSDLLEAAAEALGMTDDELRDALHDGQTIAELADAAGVDLEGIVDALVAAHQEHLAEAVADGHLGQAQADETAADLDERVAALIEGERHDRPFAGGPGPRGGYGPRGT